MGRNWVKSGVGRLLEVTQSRGWGARMGVTGFFFLTLSSLLNHRFLEQPYFLFPKRSLLSCQADSHMFPTRAMIPCLQPFLQDRLEVYWECPVRPPLTESACPSVHLIISMSWTLFRSTFHAFITLTDICVLSARIKNDKTDKVPASMTLRFILERPEFAGKFIVI